jgi:hypothetical protein
MLAHVGKSKSAGPPGTARMLEKVRKQTREGTPVTAKWQQGKEDSN